MFACSFTYAKLFIHSKCKSTASLTSYYPMMLINYMYFFLLSTKYSKQPKLQTCGSNFYLSHAIVYVYKFPYIMLLGDLITPITTSVLCTNLHSSDEQCESWSRSGHCDINPGFMHTNCAKTCGTCDGVEEATTEMTTPTLTPHAVLSTTTITPPPPGQLIISVNYLNADVKSIL